MRRWRILAISCSLMLAACAPASEPVASSKAASVPAGPPDAIALTADGRLLPIHTVPPAVVGTPIAVSGADGRLVAIDVRPKTGELYGLSERSTIYRIDRQSGQVARAAALRQRFEAGRATIADFDPVADRLRVIQSPRINWLAGVATGAVTVGRPLRNGLNNSRSGSPTIVGAAYTNSIAHARTTVLYTIDADDRPVLNLQTPPNGGTQELKGPLGIGLGPNVAFDIRSTGADDTGLLLTNRTLYAVDLTSGRALAFGPVAGLDVEVVDLALLPRR